MSRMSRQSSCLLLTGAVTGLLALSLPGCGDRPAVWTASLTINGPHKVDDRVMWVDGTRGAVFSLDPVSETVQRLRIDPHTAFATPSPARKRLLVLTSGTDPVTKGQTLLSAALTVIAVGAKGAFVEHIYPLSAPFDRISVAPDESTAIAYFSDAGGDGGAFFRNPNELAIIDLSTAAGAANPAFRTIRSLGSTPLGIAWSPKVTLGATAPRMLALVLSKNYVTYLDLAHPGRPEITVPLQPGDAAGTVKPDQVLFADDGTAFVRASGSDDVFAIALEPRPTTDPMVNDFRPLVNQPSAGKVARDMLLFSDGGHAQLLTVNTSQDLALIDAASSEFTIIPAGAPVDAILPVPSVNPTAAVIFSRSQPQSFVQFVDLKNLAAGGAKNITRRALARPVHDLVPVPGGTEVLVIHDDARTIVSILDLGPRRTDTPIQGRVPLASFDFTDDGFLVGVSPKLDHLGVLDLTTFKTLDVRLDANPVRVLAVGGRIVIDHGESQGRVTILPAATAKRDEARSLWGFFLQGLFDDNLRD